MAERVYFQYAVLFQFRPDDGDLLAPSLFNRPETGVGPELERR